MSVTEDVDLIERLRSRVDLPHMFFYMLWRTCNGTKSSSHTLHDVRIPDTVILHHSRAINWFFTSREGTIKKKGRKNLTTENLLASFHKKSKSLRSCGCAAQRYFLDDTSVAGYTTQFMSAADLSGIASDGSTCVLQQFIEPKTERGTLANSEIVGRWTPNVFIAEKRLNVNRLDVEKLSLDDRCTTNDTSRYVVTAPLVSQLMVRMLESVCQRIAQHIESVFRHRPTSIVLHFKVDANECPWVVWCSAIRVIQAAGGTGPQRSVICALDTRQVESPPRESPRLRRMAEDEDATPKHGLVPLASFARRSSAVLMRRLSVISRSSIGSESSLENIQRALSVSAAPVELELDPPVECALCHAIMAGSDAWVVPRKHLLFPLSVLSFYSSHSRSTPFYEEWRDEDEVPPHVLLLHPQLTSAQYAASRNNPEWLNEGQFVCSQCGTGLHALTESIRISGSGVVQCPVTRQPRQQCKQQASPPRSKTVPLLDRSSYNEPVLSPQQRVELKRSIQLPPIAEQPNKQPDKRAPPAPSTKQRKAK